GMDTIAGFDVQVLENPARVRLFLYDPVPGISNRPVLGIGSVGPAVLAAEQMLRELGYLARALDTAKFDEELRRAVVAFQQDGGVIPDGQIGPETWALFDPPAGRNAAYQLLLPGIRMDGRAPPPPLSPTATPPPTATPTTPAATPTTPAAGSPVIYLTFDDGPNGKYTPLVLDVLARYNAAATFFVLGKEVERKPSMAARIVAEGHTIGNHIYHHRDLNGAGLDAFVAEVGSTQQAIAKATGHTSLCLRPPYGATGPTVRARADQLGLVTVLWDIDPQDWRRPGSTLIASDVIETAYDGAIVLLHDGGGDRSQTVQALETILATLSQRGYRFASLDC
ncbi:MAG: polysaccharide deacetylase family protein, partial [Dehalococcoidia bacterium]|nr:polysaccharide deacetylase family protein [Dehalococcoidia bacterium]